MLDFSTESALLTGKPIDRRRASSRRGAILEHAQRLFLAHGLHQVTTRQIAHAAGISQPSLYAHFPTRDAIAVELCRLAFAELETAIVVTAARTTGCERIRALGQDYIDFGLTNPAAYRVAFMLEWADTQQVERQLARQIGLRTFEIVIQAYRTVAPDEPTAVLAAQSGWACIHGLVALFLARPDFPFGSRERLIALHLDGVAANCCRLTERDREKYKEARKGKQGRSKQVSMAASTFLNPPSTL